MKYIGIDIETTGLDPARDRILEITAIALDKDYAELKRYHAVIWHPRALLLELMNDWALETHTKNSLLDDVGSKGAHASLVEWTLVEQLALEYKPTILGNSVHFDFDFLRHWMPTIPPLLHYRHFDVRTLITANPDVVLPESSTEHRSTPDIEYSIAVAKAIREATRR